MGEAEAENLSGQITAGEILMGAQRRPPREARLLGTAGTAGQWWGLSWALWSVQCPPSRPRASAVGKPGALPLNQGHQDVFRRCPNLAGLELEPSRKQMVLISPKVPGRRKVEKATGSGKKASQPPTPGANKGRPGGKCNNSTSRVNKVANGRMNPGP